MGTWCILIEGATTSRSVIFGEQGNSLQHGENTFPLSFSLSFSGWVWGFFNIICNLGKQNWASMNKIITSAGGDG